MIKKYLAVGLLSLISAAAYADAAITMNITHSANNQIISLNETVWGYQFNDATDGKNLEFKITVDNQSGPVNVQCWHGMGPVVETRLNANESTTCLTNDAIRVVMTNETGTAKAHYSINVL